MTDSCNNDADIIADKPVNRLADYATYTGRLLARMAKEQKKLSAQELTIIQQLSGETVLVVRPGCHAWQWIAAQALSARTGLTIEIREIQDISDAAVIVAVGVQPAIVIAQLTAMVLRGAAEDLLLAGERGEIVSLKSGVIADCEMHNPFGINGGLPSTWDAYQRQVESGLHYTYNKD